MIDEDIRFFGFGDYGEFIVECFDVIWGGVVYLGFWMDFGCFGYKFFGSGLLF